jgi:hypothetical protein
MLDEKLDALSQMMTEHMVVLVRRVQTRTAAPRAFSKARSTVRKGAADDRSRVRDQVLHACA